MHSNAKLVELAQRIAEKGRRSQHLQQSYLRFSTRLPYFTPMLRAQEKKKPQIKGRKRKMMDYSTVELMTMLLLAAVAILGAAYSYRQVGKGLH